MDDNANRGNPKSWYRFYQKVRNVDFHDDDDSDSSSILSQNESSSSKSVRSSSSTTEENSQSSLDRMSENSNDAEQESAVEITASDLSSSNSHASGQMHLLSSTGSHNSGSPNQTSSLNESDSGSFEEGFEPDFGANGLRIDNNHESESDQSIESDESESAESSVESEENVSEASDNNEDDNPGDRPLYAGSPLTIAESLIAILTVAMTHKLSGVCVESLLKLISLHCPVPNHCTTTLYKFHQYFADMGKNILKFHYFCVNCQYLLESKDHICVHCNGQNEVSYFLEIPLLSQIQRLFSRPGFIEDLRFRFERQKHHANNVEDIYDGELYQSHFRNNGFLSNLHNLSFMWYSDGISIFKSATKFSIWPLYLVVNELSYSKRTLKDNIILAGLYFGNQKPNANLFLQPFLSSLNDLKEQGYLVNPPDGGSPFCVKGIVLCGTCDLQAKAIFMRMKMYNGYYGCSKCKSRGERYGVGRSSVHVHRYSPDEMTPRINAEVVQHCELADQYDGSYFGLKGPSLLYSIMEDMILGCCIDVMHCVYMGLIKLLSSLWFNPKYLGMPFSHAGLIEMVSHRMQQIKVPSFVQRVPKAFDKKLDPLKAAEYKNWFFYYSLPVLIGILDERYLQHYVRLVSAVYLLSQNSISNEQIDAAEHLLQSYVEDFQDLYGLRYMGMNVHQILHLPDMVRQAGPLWVYSCFFLEDLNGRLGSLVHGTRYAGLQICSTATLYMSLSAMIDNLPANSEVRQFCLRTSVVKRNRVKIAENISDNTKAVGTYLPFRNYDQQIMELLHEKVGRVGGKFQIFYRLQKKNHIYFSEMYPRLGKRTTVFSNVIVDNRPVFCKMLYFLRWSNCQCDFICHCVPAKFLSVVQCFKRVEWFVHDVQNARVAYLSKVELSTDMPFAVIDVLTELKQLCFFIECEGDMYIAHPINDLERE